MRNFKHPNDVRAKIEVSIQGKNKMFNLNQRGHLTITELGIEKKTTVSGALSDNLVQREDSFSAFSISKKA